MSGPVQDLRKRVTIVFKPKRYPSINNSTDGSKRVVAVQMTAIVADSCCPRAPLWMQPDMRRLGRLQVIKAAKLTFGAAALDCVLLDISHAGVRLYLPVCTEVPDVATLHLKDGEARTVRRRWHSGQQAGFESTASADPMM